MTDARFEEMSRVLAELGRKHGESHPSWTLQGMLHEGTLDGELPAKLMKALEETFIWGDLMAKDDREMNFRLGQRDVVLYLREMANLGAGNG